ncbi:DUF3489 domain-containing protein [Stenotrophobium rhamnosiphilum]|uniref:DUF3489 domain-containing protein n=1 Tax=Stenotrophobium rhamnosiphilum TaxID=2029166 RepID=A0A2T5MBM3_9GAMM|nr:DUF3489 domain-containing protein [Stenotrophobium rhamnosiphilum]PTU29132.1 hypothetical protein CJD38_17440 [Stenotrophobium rhamnosiphilum]
MRCYLFTDHRVTVCADAPNEIPPESVLIGRSSELDPKRFPVVRLLAIHNALLGVNPIKRFADRKIAIKTVWAQLGQLSLGEAKAESKQALIIRLLRQPTGCDIPALVEATGWQSHSIRGLISGTLRKRQGLKVDLTMKDGCAIYRIAS